MGFPAATPHMAMHWGLSLDTAVAVAAAARSPPVPSVKSKVTLSSPPPTARKVRRSTRSQRSLSGAGSHVPIAPRVTALTASHSPDTAVTMTTSTRSACAPSTDGRAAMVAMLRRSAEEVHERGSVMGSLHGAARVQASATEAAYLPGVAHGSADGVKSSPQGKYRESTDPTSQAPAHLHGVASRPGRAARKHPAPGLVPVLVRVPARPRAPSHRHRGRSPKPPWHSPCASPAAQHRRAWRRRGTARRRRGASGRRRAPTRRWDP